MGETRSFHWAWVILAICFVDVFISYSVRLGYGVVLPEMIRDLGFTRTAGGSIYNAYLFSYLVLTPVSGYLTDRLGGRRVIAACSLILGIGVLLMGTTRSLWTACAFYAVVGAGASGMWTPLLTLVQRWYAPRRRGLALGIMSSGYGLGLAAMGAVFPWIVREFDWRYAWYFLGAGALAMVAVNSLLLRSDPGVSGLRPWGEDAPDGAAAPAGKSPPRATPLSQVFRKPIFWLIGLSYFCIAYSLYGFTTFMVDYARSQLGLPLDKASFLATVHGFAQVLGVLTVLPLSDRLGRRNTMILSNAFIAAALVGVLFSRTPGTLYAFVGIMAVFYGATFPMYGACGGDYFPKDVMGTVIGAWTPFYGLGAILSNWVIGWLRDRMGVYDQAFIINAVMAGTAMALMVLVRAAPHRSPAK
ncbi:MAG: MFS transporter [Thermodesulfobacteriota bacterium]